MQRFIEKRLTMRQLRTIEAIDRCGSLSSAAISLCVTQPAISKSLHEAEQIFGVKVFERRAKGMVRTAEGDGPIQVARETLGLLHRLEDELDRRAVDAADTVAVGALSTAALGLLPGVCAAMRRHHPHVHIRIIEGLTGDLMTRLASGTVDLVVGRIYDDEPSGPFLNDVLFSEPLAVFARAEHPYFQDRGKSRPLSSYETILPTYSQRFGPEIESFAVQLGLVGSGAIRSGSIGLVREMLHSTDVITILPKLMLAGDLARGSLRIIPAAQMHPKRDGGLIFRRDRPLRPGAQLLVCRIREQVTRLIERGTLVKPASASALAERHIAEELRDGMAEQLVGHVS